MAESLPRFVHLRLHSEFSIVDGTVRIEPLVQAAGADGQAALALTDSTNMFGAVRFYQAARRRGLKPILGVDVAISNEIDREQPHRLLLLAQERAGYLNLCDLLSRASLQNQHRNRAELRAAWLQGISCSGLIALSGSAQGEIGMHLAAGNDTAARAVATRWAAAFPNRFYIEVQRAGRSGDESLVRASVGLAAQLGLPVVATHPVQFL